MPAMKLHVTVEQLRKDVERSLDGAGSNEEVLWNSGVLNTLNWVLGLDSQLPVFRDIGGLPAQPIPADIHTLPDH